MQEIKKAILERAYPSRKVGKPVDLYREEESNIKRGDMGGY